MLLSICIISVAIPRVNVVCEAIVALPPFSIRSTRPGTSRAVRESAAADACWAAKYAGRVRQLYMEQHA